MPIQIESIYTHNMRNNGHFQFHTDFKILVNKHNPETLKIKLLFDRYMSIFEIEDLALKKISKSGYTKKISDANKACDIAFYTLEDYCRLAMRDSDPVINDSATEVGILIKGYGRIPRMRTHEQTAATTNLLQDLKGRYAAHVANANLGRWVNEFEARNQALQALMANRVEEAAAKPDVSMKDVRPELNAAFRSIANCINVYIDLEGEEAYKPFARELNELIAKHEALNNRPRKLAKKPGPGEPGK